MYNKKLSTRRHLRSYLSVHKSKVISKKFNIWKDFSKRLRFREELVQYDLSNATNRFDIQNLLLSKKSCIYRMIDKSRGRQLYSIFIAWKAYLENQKYRRNCRTVIFEGV